MSENTCDKSGKRLIDLHTHSNFSDGTLSPSELVLHARDNGIMTIALTDHDTVDGIDIAKETGAKCGVEVIEGTELVAEYKNAEIHILAYFLDYKGQYFMGKLDELKEIRRDRNERLIARLNSLNIMLSEDQLLNITGGKMITRMHFAKAMYQKGYVKSIKDAFDRYLSDGKPAYVGRNAFDYDETIDIIKNSGGVSVLAHPYIYKWKGGDVIHLVDDMAAAGINGVEAVYPLHDKKQTSALFKAANRLGLKMTGGSDFHGENKPNIRIGTGLSNIEVHYEILTELRR